MSNTRSIFAQGTGLCILAAACWLGAGAFPLAAQVTDGAGVTVDLGGVPLMHRTAVAYPAAALAQHIEGMVAVEATLAASGNVTDAHVVSGTDELRKTALLAVLQWHFGRAEAGTTRMVTIRFQTPAPAIQPAPVTGLPGVTSGMISQQMVAAPKTTEPQRITGIRISGLGDPFKDELMASLPVHQGDLFGPDTLTTLTAAVRQYDEHLGVGAMHLASGGLELRIAAPGGNIAPTAGMLTGTVGSPAAPNAVQVGAAIQEANLIKRVMPAYPPLAREARIQGHVAMNAVIGKDGTVQNLTLSSGHPMLAPAAMEAVKQWVYKPTLMNGQPVDVATQIDVNFTLADQAPAQQ